MSTHLISTGRTSKDAAGSSSSAPDAIQGRCSSMLALCRLGFAALLTAIFAHAQLTAAPMWSLITGQGVYDAPSSAWSGVWIYAIGILLTVAAPRGTYQVLERDVVFRCLKWVTLLLGFSIIYPAAFHYFYDIPAWCFAGGTLVALMFALFSIRWCRWLVPFSFCVTLAIGSFMNVPHYTWDITDLRHTLNAIALLNGVITATAIARLSTTFAQNGARAAAYQYEQWQPDRTTLLVLLGFGCIIGYFYAGFGKVAICSRSMWMVDGIRWIWLERLDKFFQLFFHMGCTWLVPTFSPQHVYDFLGNTWVRCTACAIVQLGELAVILFLFSRRACVTGLIACQLLHLGFTFICGTFFSHWFLINTLFLLVFSRRASEQLKQQWTWFTRMGVTAAAILLCPLIFHTSVLAWSTDRSQLEIFTWHASELPADPDMPAADLLLAGDPQIDPNQLFPYEKSFQMSWRFARLLDDLNRDAVGTANRPSRGFVQQISRWYKLRMVGEWHEHLERTITPELLERDLQNLLARYHERQSKPQRSWFPAYYTHMAYNPRLIPQSGQQQRSAVRSYVLLRQQLQADHGCVYMAASPESLCRIAVPLDTATARK